MTRSFTSRTAFLRRPVRLRALTPLAVFCSGFWLSGVAHADPPPAGSTIGNQATATYSDGSATERFAQSNVVRTTVLQVPAVQLVQDNAVIRTPGAPVYFSHTITNTGNGPDTFDITATDDSGDNFDILGANIIYADANDDGVPDALLSDTDGDSIPNTPVLAAGATFKYIIAGQIPSTGTASGQIARVTTTVTGNFTGGGTVSAASDTNNDQVTVTNNAAISLTKRQSVATGGPGQIIEYTLEYINTGNQAANNLTIQDALDSDLQYVLGSARWSGSGTTALGDTTTDTDPPGITYSVTGNTVSATLTSVPSNTSGRISFRVQVGATALPGALPNIATLNYDDDNNINTPPVTGTSNIVTFTVNKVPSLTFTGQTITTASQGDTVVFENTLVNTGNGPDTFDIQVNQPGTFPAGTSFQLFQENGSNGLLDTDGDSIPDTGELAAGASYKVILKAILPPSAVGNNNSDGFTVTKTATSNGPGAPTATATDILQNISGATVNLTNAADDDGLASSGVPVTTLQGNPGTRQTFVLNVINTSPKADAYLFSVSTVNNFAPVSPLPAGFSVVFKDSNGTVVSNTGSIAGNGGRKAFTAEVFIPAGAAPQNVDLFFRVLSGSTGAFDVKLDRVTVLRARSIVVDPNNSGQIYFNSAITYTHTITNTGNSTETNLTVETTGDANGFSSIAYADTDGDGVLSPTEGATPLTSIPSLLPGQSFNVIVKVISPADGPQNLTNVSTLRVILDADEVLPGEEPGVEISDSAEDVTTIVIGDVRLEKLQAIDPDAEGLAPLGSFGAASASARPGAIIRYRIVVTNTGAGDVTNVRVTDAIPNFTTYNEGDGSTSQTAGRAVWTLDGVNFNDPATSPTPPVDGGTGTFNFVIPTIPAGGVVVITFGVRINGGSSLTTITPERG